MADLVNDIHRCGALVAGGFLVSVHEGIGLMSSQRVAVWRHADELERHTDMAVLTDADTKHCKIF